MGKNLITLGLLLLVVSACSGKQKRICAQNVAYQHGYQAAQKGESVDSASTFQGNVCQDFEAYPPSLYRNDFKAGYFKGKKEYCSEFNYKKWGTEDGQQGKIDFPNHYSQSMKICLQDPDYKSLAAKSYHGSFNEAFCNDARLATLGQQQASRFEPLKTPNVKKRCGKDAPGMIAAMKLSYKEQMKTNCTQSFWVLKGEEDAKAKKSKSTEMVKVQKCPASTRDKLIGIYSSSYNERTALMLQEEKLAFEKQKQKEQMELERQRQERQYQLEKEKLQIVKDTINNATRPGSGSSGNFGRPYYFYHKGRKLSVNCMVDGASGEARIRVRNETSRHVSLGGRWKIFYYNRDNRKLRTNEEHEVLILSGHETEEFTNSFAPSNSSRCVARLNQ